MKIDKVLHFLAGYAIAASLFIATNSALLAILTVVVAGAAKETYDLKVKKTVFDKMDLFVTVLGGAALIFWADITNVL